MGRLKKVLKSVLAMASKALQIRKTVKKQEKSRNNPKQLEKLKSEVKMIGKDFKGKEPLFCIDKIAVEAAEYAMAETNLKGKEITYHPDSSGRFEVMEVARASHFNPIEEYRWANDYTGRHSISGDVSSGSGCDGNVRRVQSERFDYNRGGWH
ncbi:hypothetical protein Pyn_01927 [Prunus yedoensis var. nudiflora]|uniref:Uncharacterized protein n=1 Tax=Prunus yedoensis var. nudiflora TaxID=2094558 RepID=A0A314XTH8_PRUYE|nr:hypothetical protein Pyn_01927 [Prunus yedoensis var. nudiflora]